MKKLIALQISVIASFLGMASPAYADPVSLIASAIHGFLLSSSAIIPTLTGPLAIAAAQTVVAVAGAGLAVPASCGFLMRPGSDT